MYNIKNCNFEKRLKQIRKQKKIPVKEIISAINKTESTYYKYERGELMPDFKTVLELCNALDVDLNSFVENRDMQITGETVNPFRYDEMFLYYIGYEKLMVFKLEFSRKSGYEEVIFRDILSNTILFEGKIECNEKRAYILLSNYSAINTKFEKVELIMNVTFSSDGMYMGIITGTEDKSDMPMFKKCILTPKQIDETDKAYIEYLRKRLEITDEEKEKMLKDKFLTVDITNKLEYKIL